MANNRDRPDLGSQIWQGPASGFDAVIGNAEGAIAIIRRAVRVCAPDDRDHGGTSLERELFQFPTKFWRKAQTGE
jgi:hypothetical protein